MKALNMQYKKYVTHITAALVFFLVLGMYLLTLAPTIQEIDSGELTTAQLTLGICHSTGYPLFSIVGFLYSKIPLPFSGAYRMNLLAALWCVFAITLFVPVARLLFTHIEAFIPPRRVKTPKKSKNKDKKESAEPAQKKGPKGKFSETVVLLASGCGALMLGLSKTFWLQSTSVEVYSLHVFLIMLVIWTLSRAYIKSKEGSPDAAKAWYLFAAALALSFTNHMTTLFILPAAAYLYFSAWKFSKQSFVMIGKQLLIFFPILAAIYLYFPIRSAQNPLLNWGHPVTWENFYRHVSGWQFRVWLFESTEVTKKQLSYFADNFGSEFNISIVFAVIGFFYLMVRARKLFLFLLIMFAFTVLYSANYDIKDIDSYFLLAYIAVGFFTVFGVAQIFTVLHDNKFQYGLGVIAAVVFIGVQIYFTADKVDSHDVFTYEDYTRSILQTAEKDAVILSYEWDEFISPAYYVQQILNFRKDVTVVDKELLRRSWYYNQLRTNNASVFAPLQGAIDSFLVAVQPFEQEKPYDQAYIEMNYRAVMTGLIARNIEKHPVYLGPELFDKEMRTGELALPPGYTIIPDVFFYRVVKDSAYVQAAEPNYTLRFPREMTDYTETIKKIASGMLIRRAIYEIENNKTDRAKLYVRKLKKDYPDVVLPKELAQFIAS